MQISRIALLMACLGLLSGCDSHMYYEDAQEYSAAALLALISANRCSTEADCSAKQLLFWEAGGFVLGPFKSGGVAINIYQESSTDFAEKLARAFRSIHAARGGPKVVLSIYKNKHQEKREVLKVLEFE